MRWIGWAALAAAVSLAASGCGGSSTNNSAAGDTTQATTTSTDTTSTDTTSTDTTSTDTTASSSTDTTGSPDLSKLASGKCKDFAEAAQHYSEALATAGTGGSGDLTKVAATFGEFAKQAPEEIRADFEEMAKAFAAYAQALSGLDLQSGKAPSASDIQKITEAAKVFNQAKLQTASEHVQKWVTENCGTATP